MKISDLCPRKYSILRNLLLHYVKTPEVVYELLERAEAIYGTKYGTADSHHHYIIAECKTLSPRRCAHTFPARRKFMYDAHNNKS